MLNYIVTHSRLVEQFDLKPRHCLHNITWQTEHNFIISFGRSTALSGGMMPMDRPKLGFLKGFNINYIAA